MKQRKKLQDLTIKDNFMFGAVMMDEENCREFLELVLGFPIEKVTVSKEKSIVYHPEYKGVRLDIIAKDENHTHYNIEMQIARRRALGKRSRYYHSQIDMEMLKTGNFYQYLPDSYVIFICDYDPFGRELYRYTFKTRCREASALDIKDGVHTIFLSTCGKNDQDVPEKLVKFLKFVGAGLKESTQDYEDAYVSKLQSSVAHIKTSREMEDRYMIWEEIIEEAKAEVCVENIFEILTSLDGEIPESLRLTISEETDLKILKSYFSKALKAKSIKEFEELLIK